MRKLYTVGFVALMLATSACGTDLVRASGEVVTESRDVDSFHSVELRGSGTMTLTLGDETSVVVTTDSAFIDRITTTVEGGRLVVDEDGSTLFGVGPLDIDVTLPNLDSILISGSGSIKASELVDDLAIELTGSGDVVVSGEIAKLDVDLDGSGSIDAHGLSAAAATVGGEGSGDISAFVKGTELVVGIGGSISINAEGNVDEARIEIDGSGNFDGRDLVAGKASVNIPGSGNVTISAVDRLDVSIAGSGSVTYYGDPQVSSKIDGSGTISRG